MAEVKARLAVKPANAQVEGIRVAKAEMETSLADTPANVLDCMQCEDEIVRY